MLHLKQSLMPVLLARMNKSVQAQALYLANLLALPGFSFFLLAFLYRKWVWIPRKQSVLKIRDALDLNLDECKDLKQRRAIETSISQTELDQSHVRAALFLSLIGGILVVGGCSLIYLMIDNSSQAWPMIILYFTIMHTSFVLWGMVNLAQAMSSRLPYFKII
ncbi:MAG: hypothetical protein ACI978_002665 [Oleispira sp.]